MLVLLCSFKKMNNEYEKQAQNFLEKYNLSISIYKAIPQKKPLWCKDGEEHGINYLIEISNKDGKKYSFDFWDSIANKSVGNYGIVKYPTKYDILACLNTIDEGISFNDFCLSYGYDNDSITAQKTYKSVMLQIDGLKSILDEKALSELNDIQ